MARIPSDVRRKQFISAAVIVIARDGVDGATTRRIAEEAKAPLATLHYCFQTKENLLWAVFEQLADTVRAAIDERVPEGHALVEIVPELVDACIRAAMERPDENRAQIEIWLWAERNDAEFANRMYGRYIDAWQDLLRTANGSLPDGELETVTRVIMGLVDGLCMQFITHGDQEKILREVETSTEMLTTWLSRKVARGAA